MLNILLTKKITHNKTGKKKKKKMRLRNLWVKSNITIAPKSKTFNFVKNNKQSKCYSNTIMVRWLTNDFIYLFGSLNQLSNRSMVFKPRRIMF